MLFYHCLGQAVQFPYVHGRSLINYYTVLLHSFALCKCPPLGIVYESLTEKHTTMVLWPGKLHLGGQEALVALSQKCDARAVHVSLSETE